MIDLKNLRFAKSNKTDKSQWSTLQIKKEDIKDAMIAFSWACQDYMHDFAIPQYTIGPQGSSVPIKYDEPVNNVEIPGRFSVQFSANGISEIIETWKVLGEHYSHYQDIFKPGNDSKWMVPTLSYLIDKVEGKDTKLPEWISHILKIKQGG